MDGKPGRAAKAVLRDHEDRIAGDCQDLALPQIDDRDIDAGPRADKHLGTRASKPGVNQRREDLG